MLVEDHPVVRHGLALLIAAEPDFAVGGGAESAEDALLLIPRVKPDIVILDVAVGENSGLQLVKSIRDAWPDLSVLALSIHDEALYAERALRAGAQGYIMKKEPVENVMTAIRRVLAGEIYLSERMSSRLIGKLIGRRGAGPDGALARLSDREFEVFNLIARSIGPSEIAQRLSVSVRTVETHRERIKQKLGLRCGAELTRFSVEWTMKQQ
jgi:DNA-binding NarL/FixJ family response regulator